MSEAGVARHGRARFGEVGLGGARQAGQAWRG